MKKYMTLIAFAIILMTATATAGNFRERSSLHEIFRGTWIVHAVSMDKGDSTFPPKGNAVLTASAHYLHGEFGGGRILKVVEGRKGRAYFNLARLRNGILMVETVPQRRNLYGITLMDKNLNEHCRALITIR